MIISREFKTSDIPALSEIHSRNNTIGLPGLDNVLTNNTIEDRRNGRIIGYGVIKLFAEAILLLDKDIPSRDKVQALRAIMENAIKNSKESGLEYLYTISESNGFTRVLCNQYGFKECPGTLLILDLKPEENLGK